MTWMWIICGFCVCCGCLEFYRYVRGKRKKREDAASDEDDFGGTMTSGEAAEAARARAAAAEAAAAEAAVAEAVEYASANPPAARFGKPACGGRPHA